MKTYLVTGAAGFIGCNFVKYLIQQYNNPNIIVLDALTYAGNLESLKDEIDNEQIRFIKGSICDSDLVSKILKDNDVDYIVNFAAESHVDRSITGPRIFVETNVLGAMNMLDCARMAWRKPDGSYLEGKKYLQVSTDEVYGSLTKDYDKPVPLKLDDDIKVLADGRDDMKTYGKSFFEETTPVSPRSPYSASKTSADLLTLAYHETYKLPVNITRCSNNYGPYHFPEKLIPLLINNILQGKKLPVYGKGENVRDWLYVEDHCRAIDMVLQKGRFGESYNVGGFNEESNINIVKLVIATVAKLIAEKPEYTSLLECAPECINENLIEFVTDRPGHDLRYAINPSKIVRELGWFPTTPFTRGIELTVKWNLEHRDWVKRVTSGDYQDYYDKQYKR